MTHEFVLEWVRKAFRDYPGRVCLLLLLSILTSLADGLSISLLIPLLSTLFEGSGLLGADQGSIAGALNRITQVAGPQSQLAVIAAAIVVLVAIRSILSYFDSHIVVWVSGRIGHEIRSRIHANLLGVDFQFIAVTDNGRLLNALDGETWRATGAITSVLALFTNFCMVIAFTAILLDISWNLTALVALLMVLVSLLRRTIDRRSRTLGERMVRAAEDLSTRACELFDSMRMIRAFGREAKAQRTYEDASRRVLDVDLQITRLNKFASSVQEILHGIIFAVLIFVAIDLGLGGASIIAYLALLHRLQPHIKAIDETRTHLIGLSGSIDVVSRLLKLGQWADHATGNRVLPALNKGVRFDDVSFAYAGKSRERRNALEQISLEIPFGKVTAIVGSSGAGKTTLTNLLFRFHDPEAGTITVDGVPLQEIGLDWWRGQLAISGQGTDLVSGTLRENIAYARPDASDAEIKEVARAADIDEFIASLPKGYDTEVGTRGVLLSGGQRQRIELARALLRKDAILLLDEATNALDSMTEAEVFKAIQAVRGKRTIVIIAHRLSTTRMADQVIVLHKGRVAEQGPPAALYRSGGIFSKMVQLQELSYLINDVPEAGADAEPPIASAGGSP